jgi:hypothetical protein
MEPRQVEKNLELGRSFIVLGSFSIVVQIVELLSSKCKTLSSNHSTVQKKKKKRKKKKQSLWYSIIDLTQTSLFAFYVFLHSCLPMSD